MGAMKDHSFNIVEQVCAKNAMRIVLSFRSKAEIVSAELIRVAILWHERWHEGLEEASRLYFTEKNADGMIAVLQPLHDLLDQARPCLRITSGLGC